MDPITATASTTDTHIAQEILDSIDGDAFYVASIEVIDDMAVAYGLKGHVLDEIRLAIHKAIAYGKPIKINTTLIKHMYGDYTRKQIVRFFQECPYIKLVENYCIGAKCKVRGIDFKRLKEDHPEAFSASKRPTKGRRPCPTKTGVRWGGSLDGVPGGARGCSGIFAKSKISMGFLKWRIEKWKEVCKILDWNRKVETEFEGKEKFEEFFAALELDPSVVYAIADTPEELQKLQEQFARLLVAKKDYHCFKLRGRVYDSMTNISKKLRRALRIRHNGKLERIAEVDLHATYMYLLLGQMEQDSEEIRREIAEISKYFPGCSFYEFVYSLLPDDVARRIKNIKKEFQMQVMFPAKRPFSSCPVYHALLKKFPIVFGRIRKQQLDHGYTEFSHFLTESEGTLFIDSVLKKLKETLNALHVEPSMMRSWFHSPWQRKQEKP
ncbi:MAG: hypothetical protein U0905_20975 [Pirellulales bacterium]